jgi:hypothetical protein
VLLFRLHFSRTPQHRRKRQGTLAEAAAGQAPGLAQLPQPFLPGDLGLFEVRRYHKAKSSGAAHTNRATQIVLSLAQIIDAKDLGANHKILFE